MKNPNGKASTIVVILAVFAIALVAGVYFGMMKQPKETLPTMEEMVPPALAALFDTFDLDKNGEVDIGEAEEFFKWIRANIQYRYDDEYESDPIPGYPVGDGRAGLDYWQKPIETYTEGAGDCEDMAILNVAFYRYYGIDAYAAWVNAEGEKLDHVVCVVKIGMTPEEVAEYTGGEIVYYELEDGYYLLVDCAYSDQFGTAGSDPSETTQILEKGRFTIESLVTLEEAYATGARL